jgi:hypothetical protein
MFNAFFFRKFIVFALFLFQGQSFCSQGYDRDLLDENLFIETFCKKHIPKKNLLWCIKKPLAVANKDIDALISGLEPFHHALDIYFYSPPHLPYALSSPVFFDEKTRGAIQKTYRDLKKHLISISKEFYKHAKTLSIPMRENTFYEGYAFARNIEKQCFEFSELVLSAVESQEIENLLNIYNDYFFEKMMHKLRLYNSYVFYEKNATHIPQTRSLNALDNIKNSR